MKYFLIFPILFFILIPSFAIADSNTFAHQDNPTSPRLLFEEGMRLREIGDLNNAEWHIKRALEIDPANADYRLELANIYAIQYDLKGKKRVRAGNIEMLEYSARQLEQAVMLQPDSIPARFNLGVVRKNQGRYEEAREEFREVLEYDPKIVNVYLQIAATYEDQGFFDEAKDAYMQAYELDYGNPNIQASMEDLKILKAEDRERMLNGYARERFNRYGGFEFSPGSQAHVLANRRLDAIESGQGIQAAVPYLTFWLVDQFMKLKDRDA